MNAAAQSPLDSSDADRARTLKFKITDRLKDVRRHLDALRAAMASFGEDFDFEPFKRAFESSEPDELNRVKAIERGVDQLFNYVAELTMFGLELAGLRERQAELNARRDLRRLAQARVITGEQEQRLQRLRELRRLTAHEYPVQTAAQVHEAARLILAELPAFYRAYAEWVRRGFVPNP